MLVPQRQGLGLVEEEQERQTSYRQECLGHPQAEGPWEVQMAAEVPHRGAAVPRRWGGQLQ